MTALYIVMSIFVVGGAIIFVVWRKVGRITKVQAPTAEKKLCPFGIDARHCEHQETRAKDLLSAMKGELVFLCTLDRPEDCPRMKELFNSVLEDKSDTS